MNYKHFTVKYYKEEDGDARLAIFPIGKKSQVEHLNFNYNYTKQRVDMFQQGIPTEEQIAEREVSLDKEIQTLQNTAQTFLGPGATKEMRVFNDFGQYFTYIHEEATTPSISFHVIWKGAQSRESDPETFNSILFRLQKLKQERYSLAMYAKYRKLYSDEQIEELIQIFKEAVERLS